MPAQAKLQVTYGCLLSLRSGKLPDSRPLSQTHTKHAFGGQRSNPYEEGTELPDSNRISRLGLKAC